MSVKHIVRFFFMTGLLLLTMPSLGAEAYDRIQGGKRFCPAAEELLLDTTVRGRGTAVGGRDCYRVTVVSSGILTLDASDLGEPGSTPRLVVHGVDPDGGEAGRYRIVRRTPRGAILYVEVPGSLLVSVASEDPERPLARYKLRNAFVEGNAVFSPEGTVPLTCALLAAMEERLTFGPGTLPGGTDKDVEEQVCDPIDPIVFEPTGPLCDASWGESRDDHGDTALCATALRPGASVSGRVDGIHGDDEDFFTFVLDAQRTVALEVRGAAEVSVTLYGASGLRLAASANGRLVRTLPPGRYHLRLLPSPMSPSWGESYVLTTGVLDEEAHL